MCSSIFSDDRHSFAALTAYGWDQDLSTALAECASAESVPARVLAAHRGAYDLVTPTGERRATLAGRLRQAATAEARPAVGDWVAARLAPDPSSTTIEAVLPRRSAFVRQSPGRPGQPQVIAANVDTVFVVDGLDHAPHPRRLERYLVLAWDSGASPVVVLSKADRCADVAAARTAVDGIAAGVQVLVCSAASGEGLEQLAAHLRPGRTVALLGPSGVGKSTLVNYLCGQPTQQVGAVRAADGKGRHTTSSRCLLLTPSGGLVVDTPGLRELALGEAAEGLERAFVDVETVARACRFGDCRHDGEPGCAVADALADGALTDDRLASYHKLQRELRQQEARRDPRVAAEARQRTKVIMKAYNSQMRRRERGG